LTDADSIDLRIIGLRKWEWILGMEIASGGKVRCGEKTRSLKNICFGIGSGDM
jgi:hypothetical protein